MQTMKFKMLLFFLLLSCKSVDYTPLNRGKIINNVKLNGLWQGSLRINKEDIFIRIRFKDDKTGYIDIVPMLIFDQNLNNIVYEISNLSFDFRIYKEEYHFEGNIKKDLNNKYIIQGNLYEKNKIVGFLDLETDKKVDLIEKKESVTIKLQDQIISFQFEDEYIDVNYSKAIDEKAIVLFMQDIFGFDKDGNIFYTPDKNNFLLDLKNKLNDNNISVLSFDFPFLAKPLTIEKYALNFNKIINWMKTQNKNVNLLAFNESNLIAIEMTKQNNDFKLISVNSILNNFKDELLDIFVTEIDRKNFGKEIDNFILNKKISDEYKIYLDENKKEYIKSVLNFDLYKEYLKIKDPLLFLYGKMNLKYNEDSYKRLMSYLKNKKVVLIDEMNYILKDVTENNNMDSYIDSSFDLNQRSIHEITNFVLNK